MHSVVKKWKSTFNQSVLEVLWQNDGEQTQLDVLTAELIKLKSKSVYLGFVNRLTVRPVCENYLKKTFGVQEDEWSQIYLMPFKCHN